MAITYSFWFLHYSDDTQELKFRILLFVIQPNVTANIKGGGYGYFFQKFSFTFFSLYSIVHYFKSIQWKFEVDPRKIDEVMDILVNPPPYRILAPTAHKSSWVESIVE